MKRTPARIIATLATGAAVFSTASGALAQDDIDFAVPDVLLLVDTSGSMGFTSVADDTTGKYIKPTCGSFDASTNKSVPVDVTATSLAGAPADRWAMLVNVLTGSVAGMSCGAQQRNSTQFRNEYALGPSDPPTSTTVGVSPYDRGYYLPFNRIVATKMMGSTKVECTPSPSWNYQIREDLKNNAVKWPALAVPVCNAANTYCASGPVYWRDMSADFDETGTPTTDQICPFDPQDTNGLLDQFTRLARFGLMTFDPSPHWLNGTTKTIGTGISGTSPPIASATTYEGGVGDTWSFFEDWMTSESAAAQGFPAGCGETTNAFIEVGARNPGAPPWEGRMIDFGDPFAEEWQNTIHNQQVQDALAAMRPYGATPIAGMLSDAAYFLLHDTTALTETGKQYFWGGALETGTSTTLGAGCRDRFVILLTDGGPNMDLRPDCVVNLDESDCPYQDTPEESAEKLADNNIPVYVIGFAVTAEDGGMTCTELLDTDDDGTITLSESDTACGAIGSCDGGCPATAQCAYGYCIDSPEKETLATCCTLQRIAYKGGTTQPYFAENFGSLYTALTQILQGVIKGTRSRSQPVFATGNANFTDTGGSAFASARFLSSFKTVAGQLFEGELERERYECTDEDGALEAKLRDFDPASGDSFGKNVDDDKDNRWIYTVVADEDSAQNIYSRRSIRPLYTGDGDGLQTAGVLAGANATTHMVGALAKNFSGVVNARAVVTSNTATCFDTQTTLTAGTPPTAIECKDRYLDFQLGFKPDDTDIGFQRDSVFGAIMNTSPVLAGPPQEYLRDESYTNFQRIMAKRPAVLYTPTNDGQLHAFKITSLDGSRNELWSFMPPAVLPLLMDQFPDRYHAAPQALLDGPITIRDVAGRTTIGDGRFLQRVETDAKTPANTQWYTVLVGAFGTEPGFYALDVSWPDQNNTTDKPAGYALGPRFLWQLTTATDPTTGEPLPLFGSESAPPAIATLFFAMPSSGDAEDPAQHAVAILPGGDGGTRIESPLVDVPTTMATTSLDGGIGPRTQTHDYAPNNKGGALALGGARSLTIVRLDTGEIIRTFRRAGTDQYPSELESTRVTTAPFSAPLVGHVIPFPNGAGSVADRAFVGDAEGRLWRIDLSSKDPADWSVKLFHDAYPLEGTDSIGYASDALANKAAAPIMTPPILSTDPTGRLTIAFSTGAQRSVTSSPTSASPEGDNSVWSLTEIKDGATVTARINWVLDKSNAKNPATADDPHLTQGERVTGPMSLFDSVLYFTTYDPAQENLATCTAGRSYLWGVHYINAGTSAATAASTDASLGPMPWLDPNESSTATAPSAASTFIRYVDLGAGSVAFGVGLNQKPACYEVSQTDGDPFLGFGAHNSITNIVPSEFQLVVQTGRVGDTGSTETKTTKRDLFPPTGGGRIDSWAAILE